MSVSRRGRQTWRVETCGCRLFRTFWPDL